MSSLRLALKQSLEESGILPAKMARDRERKRMEVEFRKKKLKQQQQQQQRRKPGDPPRKRGRPPKNRQIPVQPIPSEQDFIDNNHDDDSSEVEATFSSDEGFAAHDDSDSQREENSHHSASSNIIEHNFKREAEEDDPLPNAISSTVPNKLGSFPPKLSPSVSAKSEFEEEEDDGYHNQDGEDIDEESESSEKVTNKKLQKKQETAAADIIKRGWKKQKGIAKRENMVSSSSSSSTSSGEPPVSSIPDNLQGPLLPPPPSMKKTPKEAVERNKKDSNPHKAKTVPAPSKELIEWMRTLSKKKMKRHVSPGLRVKVRFAARIKRDGKSIRKLKWYGGVVSKVGKDGSKIRIKYDDGTSEISPFPDPDIVVDDELNGCHECTADWFIPDPPENDNIEGPSSPLVEKKMKRPAEGLEIYADQSTPLLPSRPPKKMKRCLPVTSDGDNPGIAGLPSSLEAVSPDPVEPTKMKQKPQTVSIETTCTVKRNSPVVQEIIHEVPVRVTRQQDEVSSTVMINPRNTDIRKEISSSSEESPDIGGSVETSRENKNESEITRGDTACVVDALEDVKPAVEKVVWATKPVVDQIEIDAQKIPMVTLRLSKQHVPNDDENRENKALSSGKSRQSREVVPFASAESFDDETFEDDEEEDELAVERSSVTTPPEVSDEVREKAVIPSDAGLEKDKRPSKRIYIKLDLEAAERKSATIEDDTPCFAHAERISRRPHHNIKSDQLYSNEGEKVNSYLSSANGCDDIDFSSPPPMDDQAPTPAVVSLSAKRHAKGVDRLVESIKPRRLSPIRKTESPTPISSEPLNTVAKTEIPKPHSVASGSVPRVEQRPLTDESSMRKNVPILTSSKNSAFSKKESLNSPLPSKATLRISLREQSTCDDDESSEAHHVALRQRGSKSSTSAPRGRRAAHQANLRTAVKQEATNVQEGSMGKKKRKRDKIDGRKRDDGEESESSDDDRQWVQCDNCRKWRLLPSNIEPAMLPKLWYCDMNTYDPKRSSCVAPEQTAIEFARERKRAKKKLRQRPESPEETVDNASDEASERREAKPDSSKRLVVRSPIPVKEKDHKDHSLKGTSKVEHEADSKPKRTSPDSNIIGYRSPVPERDLEQKAEKRMLGLSSKKCRPVEASEGASSSDGALEAVKVRGRGRGRTRMAKEQEKDQEKAVGAKIASQEANEADNVEWVQCEKCDKWRKLPPHIAADDLPDVWYCSMNTWNPSSASCEAAEDKAEGHTHELSIFGGSSSNISNKLSYRNLIFGTGKKFNRPISERTRAMESLFATDDIDGYPTVMYANSCAFVPRAGLRGASDPNNGAPTSLSFLDLMKHSSLWTELRGVGERINNYSNSTFSHPYQSRTSFEAFTDDMKLSMKEIVCQALGSRTLAGHEVLLEAQCRQWENVPPAWAELRPYCTVEIVVSALIDLVKDGVVELVEEPGSDRQSKDWIPRYRCTHVKTAEPPPALLTDEGTRVSRCIKISKPWKNTQSNGQWMLFG